ncbi:chaplin [Streptomyces sp. NPDC050625]|uniref:chaplin n=1 Tax=Streptomyces sp. NPDC050625 TaxID=3154629 RepID=UPI0034470524
MRRVARNGVIAVAVASGAMAVTMPAFADSGADGSAADSPGLISGNTIQLPLHVPVNVCGNTVNVGGLLDPAAGNTCDNAGGGGGGGAGTTSSGGATAHGGGEDAPGVVSGNTVQLPVHVPVNVSGNSVNVVGVGNPGTGNESVNTPGERPHQPTAPVPPRAHPRTPPPHRARPQTSVALAHTGTDLTAPALAGSAAFLITGVALYRRFRPRPQR